MTVTIKNIFKLKSPDGLGTIYMEGNKCARIIAVDH